MSTRGTLLLDARWALPMAGKEGGVSSSSLIVPSESSSSDACGDDTSTVGASESSTESVGAAAAEAVSNVNQFLRYEAIYCCCLGRPAGESLYSTAPRMRGRVRDRGGKKQVPIS